MELDFDKVTVEITVTDVIRIENLIDAAIQDEIERGNASEPHLNPRIADLMSLYHRVIPDALKPAT